MSVTFKVVMDRGLEWKKNAHGIKLIKHAPVHPCNLHHD